MAVRKIIMRPPGEGNYADELHPRTSANVVVTTDGNVQTDINTLKTAKADKSYTDTELGKKANTSHTHTKANITDFTHTHTTADITNFPTLGTAASKNTGTASGNIPVLDAGGKLSESILPKLAITDTFTVASQAAMLALTAETGDIAIRTDVSATFILTASPATTLANWKQIATPMDAVSSVNSKTGAVTLTHSDVGAAPTVHTHTKNQITDFPTIPSDTSQLTKTDVYTKTEVDNKLGSAGYGDMLKSVYDPDDDGKVNAAVTADNVPWAGVTGVPSTYAPSTHSHTVAQITDFPNFITIGTVKPTDGSMWYEEI